MAANHLYYGDNLDVLREHVPSGSVDLVYLDPPFNSNRSYNVIFARHDVKNPNDEAQIQAFDDTWHWTPTTDDQYRDAVTGGLPSGAADALRAFRTLLGENDAMAYLVNMAPRLVELHRVLKVTGSLYLHCDPTMSHYLKVLLDTTFGPERFVNEVIWKRSSAHSGSKKWGAVHDSILVYSRGSTYTWNPQYTAESRESVEKWYVHKDERGPYKRGDLTGAGLRTGVSGQPWRGWDPSVKSRHWAVPREVIRRVVGDGLEPASPQGALDLLFQDGRIIWPKKEGGQPMLKRYLHEAKGVPAGDVLTDIPPLSLSTSERLGYPTQKPLALLGRIIGASSNAGDVVLDPFCGCGTTIDAAHKLGRQWVGIDITYIAVDLIEKRLLHTYGEGIRDAYEVSGIPRDLGSAQALFRRSPFDFERWAVSLVNGQPNARQVGDRGVDGVVGFNIDTRGNIGRVLVSVKGGQQIGPQYARELRGSVESRGAEMGLLILMAQPTRGMTEEADHGGTYRWPVNQQTFPRVQIVTVEQLLAGHPPKMPPALLPYIAARRRQAPSAQLALDV